MYLAQLLERFPYFHRQWAQSKDISLQGISGVGQLYPDSVVFIKGQRYWKKFLESCLLQPSARIGICCASNFIESMLADSQWPLVKERALFLLSTDNLDVAICQLSEFFYHRNLELLAPHEDGRATGKAAIGPDSWIAPNVFIGNQVTIGAGVRIHPGCVIMGNSVIEDHCVLFPNVVLYYNSHLGKNCRLHAGVVIGSDGLGFNFYQQQHQKIWHWGGVHVGDNVEIGANSVVDGGTFAQTTIGAGTKIDNLVQIAHNCQIGRGVMICAQVGIAGSSVVGDFSVLGGKAGVTSDVEIGAQSQIGAMAGVTSNLPAKSVVAGHPARPLKEWLRNVAYLRKLSLKE